MKENSRCEVQKENFCDGEAGQFLDAFTDGSAGYIHGGISGAVYHITGGENARAGGMTGFVGYQKSPIPK